MTGAAHPPTGSGDPGPGVDRAHRPAGRIVVAGTISSAGFRSGDRFVVGHWPVSPIGPMGDVMWATPDDRRILLAPSVAVADFITTIYDFDDVRTGPLRIDADGRSTQVRGHGLELELVGGRRRPVPIRRPLAITRWIEAPIARRLMGVETFGTSPTGAREWYQTQGWRWVESGGARLDGADLGSPGHVERPLRVGFSEPPGRPSIVSVRVTIDLPSVTGAGGP